MPESNPKTDHSIAVESWWRTQSATMALLKHACARAEDAERRLADQERRIRQLESLAASDPLTGLMNRRGFEAFFAREQERVRRHDGGGALFALVDLDRFKQLNDTFGHRAGDACLKLVADTLSDSIRTLDGAARFGGDEFALLLTHADPEGALARVRAIKEKLGGLVLDWEGRRLRVSASIGVEAMTARSDYVRVYEAADASLYADKQRRRALEKA